MVLPWRQSPRQQPKIESGLADLVLAGGMESSSTQPLRMWNPNHPNYEKDKVWTVAQFVPGQQGEQVMLEGAERTVISEQVKKEEQDFWVLESHHRLQKPPRREFYRTSRYRWQEAGKMRASAVHEPETH